MTHNETAVADGGIDSEYLDGSVYYDIDYDEFYSFVRTGDGVELRNPHTDRVVEEMGVEEFNDYTEQFVRVPDDAVEHPAEYIESELTDAIVNSPSMEDGLQYAVWVTDIVYDPPSEESTSAALGDAVDGIDDVRDELEAAADRTSLDDVKESLSGVDEVLDDTMNLLTKVQSRVQLNEELEDRGDSGE